MANQLVYWDQVVGNEGYRVKWGDTSGVYTLQADVQQDLPEYRITGLNSGNTYYWIVAALVGGVEQTYSSEDSFVAQEVIIPWQSCRRVNIGVWA